MQLGDIMTENPQQLAPNATVWEAANLMDTNDIRHVPITKDGDLVGIVSDRDIRRYELPFDEAREDCDKALDRYDVAVSKIMRREVFSLTPTATLDEAIGLLVEGGFGLIPIVRSGSDELVGVVSYIDVLKAVRDIER